MDAESPATVPVSFQPSFGLGSLFCKTRRDVADGFLLPLGAQLRALMITEERRPSRAQSQSTPSTSVTESAPYVCGHAAHTARTACHSANHEEQQPSTSNRHIQEYPKVWVPVAMRRSHDAASCSGRIQHLTLTTCGEFCGRYTRKSPATCRNLCEVRPLRRSSAPRPEALNC